jgi:hypothetical protein
LFVPLALTEKDATFSGSTGQGSNFDPVGVGLALSSPMLQLFGFGGVHA